MSRLSILFHWAICLLLKAQFLNIKEVPVKPRSSCNRRCPGDTLPLPMTQEVLSRDQEGVGASCWEHRKGEGSQQPEWLWALKQEPRLREKQRDRLSQQGHQQKSIAKGRSTGRLCAPGHALIGGTHRHIFCGRWSVFVTQKKKCQLVNYWNICFRQENKRNTETDYYPTWVGKQRK